MHELKTKLRSSAFSARVAPFIIFAALTACQGLFGESGKYWFYVLKTIVGAWLVWAVWPVVAEMRWKFSWEGILVGVVIFAVWVGSDPFYPKIIEETKSWNPFALFPDSVAWLVVLTRIIGSTLVVPPIEEMFYRSFVYRYIIKPDFAVVPLNTFHPISFIVTSTLFGVVHREWLVGILCGLAYQWLVIRKGRLGDAMTAHAITNFLLGAWVIYRGAWHFW